MNFTSVAFLVPQLSSKGSYNLESSKMQELLTNNSYFYNAPLTQFSNSRMHDIIIVVTAFMKLGSL